MRIRTIFVGVDAHIDPCRTHFRFYETLRQIRKCLTGGQRRPPLQDMVRVRRWCVQVCHHVLPGRARHRPLRYDELGEMVQKREGAVAPSLSLRKAGLRRMARLYTLL